MVARRKLKQHFFFCRNLCFLLWHFDGLGPLQKWLLSHFRPSIVLFDLNAVFCLARTGVRKYFHNTWELGVGILLSIHCIPRPKRDKRHAFKDTNALHVVATSSKLPDCPAHFQKQVQFQIFHFSHNSRDNINNFSNWKMQFTINDMSSEKVSFFLRFYISTFNVNILYVFYTHTSSCEFV